MRDRLANIRPSRLVACLCLPANRISTLISFCPLSQSRIDFWNIMSARGWRAPIWSQSCYKLVVVVCLLCHLCRSFYSVEFMKFGELRPITKSVMWCLLLSTVSCCCVFMWLCSSICLTFLFPSFYFPCCFSCLVCLLCLALCVQSSGYEIVGWVSETLVSVWQSLGYISHLLPCIIDSLSLIMSPVLQMRLYCQ